MPIRIVGETERLIRGIAAAQQVTPLQLIRKGIGLTVEEMGKEVNEGKQSAFDSAAVEGIVMRRVTVGYLDGRDDEVDDLHDDLWWMFSVLVLLLIMALSVPGLHFLLFGLALIDSIVIWIHWRSKRKRKEQRDENCATLYREIAERRGSLPEELEFLSYGPAWPGTEFDTRDKTAKDAKPA